MQDEEYLLSTEDGPDKVKMPSIVKSTAKMSVATALSRLTGFLRNISRLTGFLRLAAVL